MCGGSGDILDRRFDNRIGGEPVRARHPVPESIWNPQADGVLIFVTWDPNVVQYVSTDWKVGNSVAATLNQPGELLFQFADWTNQ